MTSPVFNGFAHPRRPKLDLVVENLHKEYVLAWKAKSTGEAVRDSAMLASKTARGFRRGGERLPVLQGVSFTVTGGERVAIVGTSGAGKSTLLHLLGALDRPTVGSIRYGEFNVFALRHLAKFRNDNLGFIFQFHHLLPEFTALENVMMPMIIARRSRAEAEQRAHQMLEEVGLSHRVEHRPSELSGGERQRVAVARAIVMSPSVILADEPTGNLDAKTGGGIHDLLVKLNEERGMSLITVTHNPDLARRMHRQIRLVEGRASEEAPGTAMELIEERAGS